MEILKILDVYINELDTEIWDNNWIEIKLDFPVLQSIFHNLINDTNPKISDHIWIGGLFTVLLFLLLTFDIVSPIRNPQQRLIIHILKDSFLFTTIKHKKSHKETLIEK